MFLPAVLADVFHGWECCILLRPACGSTVSLREQGVVGVWGVCSLGLIGRPE
jgi:hypothetical protein